MNDELPPLPIPVFTSVARGGFLVTDGFTADQMRDYARQARAALERRQITDDALRYRWLRDHATVSHTQVATADGVDYPTTWHIVTGGSDTSIDEAIDANRAEFAEIDQADLRFPLE